MLILALHFLQPTVFVFKSLHLADHRRVHAAVFGSPFIKRRRAHPVLPA